jgi:hypothetical protein
MAHYFHLIADFDCPHCGKKNRFDSMIESKDPNPADAAFAASKLSHVCGSCSKPVPGTTLTIGVQPVPHSEFEQWTQARQSSLKKQTFQFPKKN